MNRAVRDLWYHVARLREAKGDKEGAKRARLSARTVEVSSRFYHSGYARGYRS